MNNNNYTKIRASKNIGKRDIEAEIQRIQRTKGFAYRKNVKIPLPLHQLFINRDMRMLQKMLNVKMIFPDLICQNEYASLDIYGQPKKVDLACNLVQRFILYEETTEIFYNVSLMKYENLLRENPNVFNEINAKNKVTIKFYDLSPAVQRNQKGIGIKGKRTNIDKAVKVLAELFFPKFVCVICYEEHLIEAGAVGCENNLHFICVTCVQEHAHFSVTDGPVAHGGTGLPCVYPGCNDVILMSSMEFYIREEDYMPLKLRLQSQCLIDANVEDLVSCSTCGFKASVPPTLPYYKCQCGRIQCRRCPRLYEGKHAGKTCKQMDEEEAQERSAQKLESKISETIIRKCHKVACSLQFVKKDGCNKMTCRCKATQCYICRAKDIDYAHFCRCENVRLQQQHGRCPRCKKTCRLFENAEELDEIRINNLQKT